MNFKQMNQTFVIAEIGVNHEGNEDVAADLIRRAAAARADAVKFQTFKIEHYISREQPERYERTKRFQLSHDAFRRLAHVAEEAGLLFFSTPFHMDDVDFLDEIAPIFKVSSGDLTHLDLIRHIAAKRKPMIISTGLGIESEIAAAVSAVESVWSEARAQGGLLLMHCVAAYPTPAESANLRNIYMLAERFNLPVGYSDHTLGTKACELAVAAGATAVEKHFTYRKENQSFHDHGISADPKDMVELINAVRLAETYLGSKARQRTEPENMLTHMRRSLGAALDIRAGTPLQKEHITWLRPAWGLEPKHCGYLLGRSLKRDVKAGQLIREEDVD